MANRRHLIAVTGLLLALGAQLVAAGQVYRYINEEGVPVIDDKVPPEFVSKGYDILDSSNLTLIQRVPRQLSDEELKERSSEAAREQLQKEEENRRQAWDESLLLRYSSIDDIEAARKRAIQDLKIRISILKSNLVSIKSQIEREQAKAANIERRGREVPQDLLKNINILRQEIEDTEQSIVMRREEIESVKASYQRDIERFKTLKDRVDMRRRGKASSDAKEQSGGAP